MAFQQGLSGLNASSKSIDAISNNIANAGTVGFKGAQVHFSDVYAASLQGSGSSLVGLGVSLSTVAQQFTQGNITTTNNPFDISINGNGFFRLTAAGPEGDVSYSRNGQFHVDKDGFIVNDQLRNLTGYAVDPATNTVIPSAPVDLQIPPGQIPPRASDDPDAGDLEAVLNLDSRSSVFDVAAVPPAPAFDFTDPTTYNFSTGLSVYDTLGVAHTLTTYYRRVPGTVAPPTANWEVHATLDGANPQLVGTLNFDGTGALTNASTVFPLAAFTPMTTPPPPAVPTPTGANDLNLTMDFFGTTQYGAESAVDRLTQGGYTSGSIAGVSVGADGLILGRYTNGQTRELGQVVLVKFTNPNGLKPGGDNQWTESTDSGPALIGSPASSGLGVLQASAVEESNVDLTAELVAMIVQQRNYQANAQSIKTQDQILNTLVNLR